jgi:hypothetical protein
VIEKQNRRLVGALAACMTVLALACCIGLTVAVSIQQQQAASHATVVETYQMKWANEPYGGCETYVVLEFETAPGFVISACSKELLDSLQLAGTNPVPVRFTRTAEPHFLITTWHYQIEQVGGWTEQASFFGLSCPQPTRFARVCR